MATSKSDCPVQNCETKCCKEDVVTRVLTKFGVCRSMLITLALVPFAWEGVVLGASAVKSVWDAVTTAVGS